MGWANLMLWTVIAEDQEDAVGGVGRYQDASEGAARRAWRGAGG